ncbi:hypothetical protein NFI99_11225 [Burkholderia glumae]|uniref:Uncharacterized protein n=1 Tax=Burkholderia glumae TaxID=337 RepID=A0ABY5B8A6_BURGL|nr:hypothetical protein [Burkholderia glumae]USS42745.1 hypothetical protein NFI99_11225 [Burkholderia glumae]
MAVGARIRNNQSILQIDERYKNLALWQRGATYAQQVSNYLDPVRFVAMITVPYHPSALLGYRTVGYACSLWRRLINSDGTVTYQVICETNTVPVEWIVFGDPALVSPVGHVGLRIKNPADGSVSFDSRLPYMRVIGTAQVGGVFTSGGPGPGSVLVDQTFSGKDLYLVQNVTAKWLDVSQVTQPGQPVVMPITYWNTNFYWRSQSSVYGKVDLIYSAQVQNPPIQYNSAIYRWMSVMFLDCTYF